MQVGTRYWDTSQHNFMLSCIIAVLLPSVRCACTRNSDTEVEIAGSNIIDIPRSLGSHIKSLKLSSTGISTLDLTVAVDYPVMCDLEIVSSPVITVITPKPPQTVALTSFKLASSGNFPTPPDLGPLLAGQLEYLSFNGIGITSIPDNYFENYTNLISLSLNDNPISDLNAGNIAGLRHLRSLYLSKAQLDPFPPLHIWLPNLQRLHLLRIGITELLVDTLTHLPHLRFLDLTKNQLCTIPGQEYFINLDNMAFVKLQGNPLHCDSKLCFVKVIPLKNSQTYIWAIPCNNHIVLL